MRHTPGNSATNRAGSELKPHDTVLQLAAEHRRIAEWFADFSQAKSNVIKQELASRICRALRGYAQVQEQVFYPWLRTKTSSDDPGKAINLLAATKELVEVVEHSSPIDELFDSKMRVLSDVVEEQIAEEERLAAFP